MFLKNLKEIFLMFNFTNIKEYLDLDDSTNNKIIGKRKNKFHLVMMNLFH